MDNRPGPFFFEAITPKERKRLVEHFMFEGDLRPDVKIICCKPWGATVERGNLRATIFTDDRVPQIELLVDEEK